MENTEVTEVKNNEYLKLILEEIKNQNFVTGKEDDEFYLIGKVSPQGQDCFISVSLGKNINEFVENIKEASDLDVSYETYLWLDSEGHGQAGAPYDMRDVYNDMEWWKNQLESLVEVLENKLKEIHHTENKQLCDNAKKEIKDNVDFQLENEQDTKVDMGKIVIKRPYAVEQEINLTNSLNEKIKKLTNCKERFNKDWKGLFDKFTDKNIEVFLDEKTNTKENKTVTIEANVKGHFLGTELIYLYGDLYFVGKDNNSNYISLNQDQIELIKDSIELDGYFGWLIALEYSK